MEKDERDLLDVLKFELEFLEKGGYGKSPRQPWRFQHIFEDSPACMNYDSKENPGPCSDCVLMQLVPPEFRGSRIPCRHIPLNAEAETLDELYRYADQYEIEETFGKWLRTTITKIEEMRAALSGRETKSVLSGEAQAMGEPLDQKLHPKCANPACATAFRWTAGGKFFRFRAEPVDPTFDRPQAQSVLHYWLCDRCSHVFELICNDGQGVVLKLRWPEIPAGPTEKQLPAA